MSRSILIFLNQNLVLIYFKVLVRSSMNNLQAYNILQECKSNNCTASERIIREYQIPETELVTIRTKLQDLKDIRRNYVRNYDLQTWQEIHFCDVSIAEIEGVTSKTIASLCLQLIANESKYSGTIEVCKEIVESGTCRKHNTQLLERM